MGRELDLTNKIYWRDRVGHSDALLDDEETFRPQRVGGVHCFDGRWWAVIGSGSDELGRFATKIEAKAALVKHLQ